MFIDLNDFDVVENTTMSPSIVESYFDKEQYESINSELEDQYINLHDLQINKLKQLKEDDIDEKILQRIYDNIVDFTTKSYLSFIPNLDPNNKQVFSTISTYLYELYVIYIPAYIIKIIKNDLNCLSLEQFEKLINEKCIKTKSWDFLKKSIIKHLEDILKTLNNLKKIDKNVTNQNFFKNLTKSHMLFIELFQVNTLDNFYHNYLYPMLSQLDKNHHLDLLA